MIWRIEYEIKGETQWEEESTFLESDGTPTQEQMVRAVLDNEYLTCDHPMEHFKEDEAWYSDDMGNEFFIQNGDPVPPQRFIEVWKNGESVIVGLRDPSHVLGVLPMGSIGSAASLLRSLGYVVRSEYGPGQFSWYG